ncbi:Di-sulfide bridge nucleocytoplasmic transport domain protein [Cryptosporidium felis]|nr:Di-sulfide bridge nucleocytoplasmic transport domain protein [Cryptosporidium felis]
MTEEQEIDELSERLMLKLSPVNVSKSAFSTSIEKNLNDGKNTIMIIDDKEDLVGSEKENGASFRASNAYDESAVSLLQQFNSRSTSLPPRKIFSPNQRINLINKNIKRFENKSGFGEESQRVIPISSDTGKNRMPINTNNAGTKKLDNYKHVSLSNTQEFVRLIFSVITILFTVYVVFGVTLVIKNDIESKIQISVTSIIDEMNICSKQYVDNKCQPDQRVPAMEDKCIEWEKCMSQNPTIIARKSIFTAQIIGEIINTFFDQISFKSAFFIFGFIIALVIGNYFVITSTLHKKIESDLSKRKLLL